ncbi:resolvase [Paractinoplanes durhamensis]|uniref:Resolvase n=1 Tax=Paractinoplanes durhamensis TaxID=113563 RepID=A0ABQ3ZBV6_9ACTN|nr:resolvase [Actinoplanes durhamensis]
MSEAQGGAALTRRNGLSHAVRPDPHRPSGERSRVGSGGTRPVAHTLRLVGYLRVSTIEQATHGYGLDVQRAAIRAAAEAMGARIVKWCIDDPKSGALPADERPGLTEGLTWLRDGQADGIITRDLDRLAREVTVQEAILAEVWNRCGARAFTATGEVERDDPDDPYRTAMRQMMGVFSGLERRLIVKRLRDGRKAKAAAGGHAVGRAGYGWRSVGGALVEIPAEQRGLARLKELAAGGASTRAIAATLAEEGHPTQRGGRWTSPVVARILSRQVEAVAA